MELAHSPRGVPSSQRRRPAAGCHPGSCATSCDDQEGRRAGRASPVARQRCMERKKLFRSVWFWVAIVVVLGFVGSSFFRSDGGYHQVSTSTALAQLSDHNVDSATINDKEQTLDL